MTTNKSIAIIGGGPAGLMAAETIAKSGMGHQVTIYEAMPTSARKFLLAGKSGLNLTHAEPHGDLLSRYGAARERLEPALNGFTGQDARAWALDLGTETFTGSSGRVFPTAMKASPLLRAWLKRLEAQGVTLKTRHLWTGFNGDSMVFTTPLGTETITAHAVVLALGGASWPRLGSTANWVPILQQHGVTVHKFEPSNCGFECGWSDVFAERFAGSPVKAVIATSAAGPMPGEFVISKTGVEGSLIYAHSAALREALHDGPAVLTLDLTPGRTLERLAVDLSKIDKKQSLANRLRKGAGLDAAKAGLVREVLPDAGQRSPEKLAAAIKVLRLPILRPRPIEEAISSAGGVAWDGVTPDYMLSALPGFFAAGEMLDWDAPTGGYLLTACLATGKAAGEGVLAWVR